MSGSEIQKGIQRYMDKALAVIDKLGISIKRDEGTNLATLLQDLVHVDEPKIMAIARTVQYMSTFNELVRDNVEAVNVSTRYNDITSMFDSIRDDSKTLVSQLEDNKISLTEKLSNFVMKVRRGTPHDRFEKIRKEFQEVSKDTKVQLEREDNILDAYMDFRFAVKQAEITSYEVLAKQTEIRDVAERNLRDATKSVSDYKGDDSAERSRLQLKRDEANRAFQDEDKRYQLVKDVADNLTVGYNVGETLVMKLKQTHDLKQRVYEQSIVFFTTNEHVFTTMDAVYTSQHGLHETTQTLESMKTGANKGLEDVAELGYELEKAALKAGYGATISSQSVQKLVDSIVSFQEQSYSTIQQLRDEATKNAKEVAAIVDEGKQRIVDAYGKYVDSKQKALPSN